MLKFKSKYTSEQFTLVAIVVIERYSQGHLSEKFQTY